MQFCYRIVIHYSAKYLINGTKIVPLRKNKLQ